VLVHVQPSPSVPGVSSALAGHQRLRTEEIDDGQKLLSWLSSEEGLEDAELRAVIGDAADRIVGIARETEASFIVIGSRGRGDLTSAVLGSVSSRVASTAPCPVVIVPPGASMSA
jgi:nucleotide-binding universal stress UspA family protein